jgi:hypothetical protein
MLNRTALVAAIATIGFSAASTLMTSTPANAVRATVNVKFKQASNLAVGKSSAQIRPLMRLRAQMTPSGNRNSSHRTHQPITFTVRGDKNLHVQTYRGERSRAQFNPKELTISKPVPWQK